MKVRLVLIVSVLLFAAAAFSADQPSVKTAPPTRRDNVTETMHGVPVSDPYRWLEDQNSPETRKWITDQNAYTHSMLDALPGRDALRNRISQLLKVEVIGPPIERR